MKARIKCGLVKEYLQEGVEYACRYDPEILCEDCILNGGRYSPITNKKFRGNPGLYISKEKEIIASIDAAIILGFKE
jgi:hypothetical protein